MDLGLTEDFCSSKEALDLVSKDSDIWERKPLETFKKNQLSPCKHHGFWNIY